MAPRDRGRSARDAALEGWLKASLRRQFGDVIHEPIPRALLALLGPTQDHGSAGAAAGVRVDVVPRATAPDARRDGAARRD